MVVQVASSTRDAGIMFTAGLFRDTSLSKKRIEKSRKRTAREAHVAKVTRAARKLFTSGSYPQALWGHQCVGVPPSQVRALRRLAASTTGVSVRSQRCLTSCIAVCFGPFSDPWQLIIKEQIMMWIKIMPIYFNVSHPELALAWSKAKQALCVGPTPLAHQPVAGIKVRWNNVTGPLSNMIATLLSIGWNPLTFSEWISPNGDVWSIPTQADFQFCPYVVVRAAQASAATVLWASAAAHFNGKGLHAGVAYEFSMHVLKSYRKQLIYDRAAALKTIMSGACWAPMRKFQAGLIDYDATVCPLCHEMGVDDYHQFWGCQALDACEWPEVSSTNYLAPLASEGVGDLPCLWLRGLLPADMCLSSPIPQPIAVDNIHVFDPYGITPDPDVWPPGLYGTDASGGKFGSYPQLRRCGCGVARLRSLDPPSPWSGGLLSHSLDKRSRCRGRSCMLCSWLFARCLKAWL